MIAALPGALRQKTADAALRLLSRPKNDSVYAYAAKLHDALWSQILPCIAPDTPQTDAAILKAITEGAFEKSRRVRFSGGIALASAPVLSGTIVAAAIINEIIAVVVAKYAFKWAGEI